MRRVSNHSQQRLLRGETLDLLRKSSHTEERLKCGVLPVDGLCRRERAWGLVYENSVHGMEKLRADGFIGRI